MSQQANASTTSNGRSAATVAALSRRTFLGGAAVATTAVMGVTAPASRAAETTDQYFLGGRLWANRLQDWMRRDGRIACVAGRNAGVGATVGILDQEIVGDQFTITAHTGTLSAGSGFSGFIIGTGVPGEDWRRRALVQSHSGTGGGMMVAYQSTGVIKFPDHTDEQNPVAYAELPGESSPAAKPRSVNEDVILTLSCEPSATAGNVDLTARATDASSGASLATASCTVESAQVQGGVSLISSELRGKGARFWFQAVVINGPGTALHPDRCMGPIAGTLFSLTGGVLKMTVQLMPVAPDRYGPVRRRS